MGYCLQHRAKYKTFLSKNQEIAVLGNGSVNVLALKQTSYCNITVNIAVVTIDSSTR